MAEIDITNPDAIPDFFDAKYWEVSPSNAAFVFGGNSISRNESSSVGGIAVRNVKPVGGNFNGITFIQKAGPNISTNGNAVTISLYGNNGKEIIYTPVSNPDVYGVSKPAIIIKDGSTEQIHYIDFQSAVFFAIGLQVYKYLDSLISITVGDDGNITVTVDYVQGIFLFGVLDTREKLRKSITIQADFDDGIINQVGINVLRYGSGLYSNIQIESLGFSQFLSVDNAVWQLPEIIKELCDRSGIPENLLNLTDLYQESLPVYGCFNTAENDAYTLIEELQNLHQFDTCNYDGKLNFVKRGKDSVATIDKGELVDNGSDIDKRERKDTIEVPRVLNLEYYDINGGLTPTKQISDRSLDIRSRDEEQQETAVILTANQAAQMAVINHKVLIENQKGGYEFSLPDSYAWLSTGDIITIDDLRLRITEIEIDEGFQNYTTVVDRKSAYTSDITGVPPSDPVTPEDTTVGDSVFEFLDIPILSDADDQLMFYSAVNGYDNWRGAVADLSLDGGANYIDSDGSNVPATIGYLETPLEIGPRYYPDEANTCRVRLVRTDSELESATLTEMMNRKNLCVIGNELINFGNVNEIEPGLWELEYFLRGRKGSEITSHPAGERFVVLRRQVLANSPAETYLLNKQLTFRITSVGDDTPSAIKTYLYEGVSQREREVAYLNAVRKSGNIEISWQGVGRIGSGANVSQSQYWHGYRVYVNGVAQPDQLTAGLTIPDPGGTVTIGVVQLNQYTGEGPITEVTI